ARGRRGAARGSAGPAVGAELARTGPGWRRTGPPCSTASRTRWPPHATGRPRTRRTRSRPTRARSHGCARSRTRGVGDMAVVDLPARRGRAGARAVDGPERHAAPAAPVSGCRWSTPAQGRLVTTTSHAARPRRDATAARGGRPRVDRGAGVPAAARPGARVYEIDDPQAWVGHPARRLGPRCHVLAGGPPRPGRRAGRVAAGRRRAVAAS